MYVSVYLCVLECVCVEDGKYVICMTRFYQLVNQLKINDILILLFYPLLSDIFKMPF